jgi:hypothetical protein
LRQCGWWRREERKGPACVLVDRHFLVSDGELLDEIIFFHPSLFFIIILWIPIQQIREAFGYQAAQRGKAI